MRIGEGETGDTGETEVRRKRRDDGSIQKQRSREGVSRDDGTGDQSWCVFQSESSLILWKGAAA